MAETSLSTSLSTSLFEEEEYSYRLPDLKGRTRPKYKRKRIAFIMGEIKKLGFVFSSETVSANTLIMQSLIEKLNTSMTLSQNFEIQVRLSAHDNIDCTIDRVNTPKSTAKMIQFEDKNNTFRFNLTDPKRANINIEIFIENLNGTTSGLFGRGTIVLNQVFTSVHDHKVDREIDIKVDKASPVIAKLHMTIEQRDLAALYSQLPKESDMEELASPTSDGEDEEAA